VKRKMEKQKINAIEAVALILGTILVSSISAESSSVSSDDFYEKNTSLGEIEVITELIYGPSDLPLISRISNVKITATNVFDAAFSYMGLTDLNGKCMLSSIHPGFYKIKAEKDGYVDMSLVRNYRIVQVSSSQATSVEFTLAEEGSPWDINVREQSANNALLNPIERLINRLIIQ
jgi:hypothetical protein